MRGGGAREALGRKGRGRFVGPEGVGIVTAGLEWERGGGHRSKRSHSESRTLGMAVARTVRLKGGVAHWRIFFRGWVIRKNAPWCSSWGSVKQKDVAR